MNFAAGKMTHSRGWNNWKANFRFCVLSFLAKVCLVEAERLTRKGGRLTARSRRLIALSVKLAPPAPEPNSPAPVKINLFGV